jgi:hypothetical protein
MKKPVDIQKVETKGDVSTTQERITPIDTSPRFQHFITFADTVIAGGQNALISAQSHVAFKPRRLVIAPACAKEVIIYDLKVGRNSFMFNYHGVSGTCFPPLPKDKADFETMLRLENLLVMEMDVLQPNCLMSIGVQNITEKPVRFTAMMWGVTR